MYNIKKIAGQVIDMQDDPGVVWENLIKDFWPYDSEPEIGVEIEKSACLVDIGDKRVYPVDSAENTLLSSMYFLTCGTQLFEKEAMLEIAKELKEYRDAYEVEIPREFVQSLMMQKEASVVEEEEEVFLKEAASEARGAIVLRMRVMEPLTDHSDHDEYMEKMASIYTRLKEGVSPEEAADIVDELTEIDSRTDMMLGWDAYYPDPYNSVYEGVDLRPLPSLEKKASYDGVDWSGLNLSEDIISEIAANPEDVIPTLPLAQKMMVEDYIKNA